MPTSYESLKICMTRPRVQSYSMAAQGTSSELQSESEKGVYSHHPAFWRISWVKSEDDDEGSVSIGGRLITNFRFADGKVVNAEEEDEAEVLVNRFDTTTTRYKWKIGTDKTKVMTNNPNGFQERSR